MNEDIVKKAACFIPGGSALSQEEREAAARAILALYPTPETTFEFDNVGDDIQLLAPEKKDVTTVGQLKQELGDMLRRAIPIPQVNVEVTLKPPCPTVSREPIAWIYNDEMMTPYPYEEMESYSKVEGGMRLYPVFGPVPTVKPLEWQQGNFFITARSINGVTFSCRERSGSWVLSKWTLTGEPMLLGKHPTPEAAKEKAQALHNEAVAKYLAD